LGPRRLASSPRAQASLTSPWPSSFSAAYKFLGKCYMRAGRTREATDNYRQYLDLAPNAPDAPFVKSIIK